MMGGECGDWRQLSLSVRCEAVHASTSSGQELFFRAELPAEDHGQFHGRHFNRDHHRSASHSKPLLETSAPRVRHRFLGVAFAQAMP